MQGGVCVCLNSRAATGFDHFDQDRAVCNGIEKNHRKNYPAQDSIGRLNEGLGGCHRVRGLPDQFEGFSSHVRHRLRSVERVFDTHCASGLDIRRSV